MKYGYSAADMAYERDEYDFYYRQAESILRVALNPRCPSTARKEEHLRMLRLLQKVESHIQQTEQREVLRKALVDGEKKPTAEEICKRLGLES